MPGKNCKPRYITRVEKVPQLDEDEQRDLKPVSDAFVFRTNEYYQSLIDWSDRADPIRKIVIPDVSELEPWGKLDASNEESYTRVPGLEHKYASVALLLVNDVCGAYCRFCFRKRLFMGDNDEVVRDITPGLEYIKEHLEISEVLLTGGDPLLASTRQLRNVISRLREVDHVKIIRIGSKLPAFNPFRIIDDPDLHALFREYSTPERRIYVMCHFNHPRELTDVAIQGIAALHDCGVVTVNQTPLIAGVNDDPEVLAELFTRCAQAGVPPYYVFQCRPTLGNRIYSTPVEHAYTVCERAKAMCSGLAKRARLCMSHETGKIEIIGMTPRYIMFKHHRTPDQQWSGRITICRRNAKAYWFDDYDELVDVHEPAGADADLVGIPPGQTSDFSG